MLNNKFTNIKSLKKEYINRAVIIDPLPGTIEHNTTVHCTSKWFYSRKAFNPLATWIPSLNVSKKDSIDSLNYRIFLCITQY